MPVMRAEFRDLKRRMAAHDITTRELSQMMGRSMTYLTNRFNGSHQWELEDVYFMAEILEIDLSSDMTKYFPRGGIPQRELQIVGGGA